MIALAFQTAAGLWLGFLAATGSHPVTPTAAPAVYCAQGQDGGPDLAHCWIR